MPNTLLTRDEMLQEVMAQLAKVVSVPSVFNRPFDVSRITPPQFDPRAFELAMAPLEPPPLPAPLNLDTRRAYFDD